MANVTIKLTVDAAAVLNPLKDPNLPVECRLSQSGGEDIGDFIVVDMTDATKNISHVREGDVITWVGMPLDGGDTTTKIDITGIIKDKSIGGGSVLGDALYASWTFGKTIIRQVIQSSTGGDEERYTINFDIVVNGVSSSYSLDPKIRVHGH